MASTTISFVYNFSLALLIPVIILIILTFIIKK